MRVFEIYNTAKRNRIPCARLFYDGCKDKMRIRISETAQPADLPLMLALFAERGKRTIPNKWARRWVQERIPPQGRQNLGEILRMQKLAAYNEIALLAASEGRSAQDDFMLREVAPSRVEYAVVGLGDANEDAGLEGDSGDTPWEEDAQEFDCKEHVARRPSRSWCEVLGPQIAQRRKEAGMTQRDLAEKTGIDQAAISRIESGKANPTINTLDALVEGVGFSLLVKMV